MRLEKPKVARARLALALVALIPLPSAALAGPCLEWRAPERIGGLDPRLLAEESGLVPSRTVPGRLYHINDSGDGPNFYLTDLQGGETSRVAVSGFTPRDVEDIALGSCAGANSCLYLGDIGDNAADRTSVTFVEIVEQDSFPDTVAPLRTIEARYPDGPHNAEGFAIHPDGDLYLITKAANLPDGTSAPAQIFRLTASQLAAPAGAVQTFAEVGALDLPRYVKFVPPLFVRGNYSNQVATALDISADGTRAVILTYREAFEWNQDLSQPLDAGRSLEEGRDYTLTSLAPLPQAEAVAYLPSVDGIVYSSETAGLATGASLYLQTCARR